MLYCKPVPLLSGNEAIASIDKVKITFKPLPGYVELMNRAFSDEYGLCEIYHKTGFNKYTDMHVLTDDDAVVVIGSNFRDFNGKFHSKCFIEYNPNKVYFSEKLRHFLRNLYCVSVNHELHHYDVAIDFLRPRADFWLHSCNGSNYAFLHSTMGVTEYIGVRGSNGRIKLYDKSKESKLPYNCTRFEITFDKSEYLYELGLIMTKCLYVRPNCFDYSNELKGTDLVLIDLLSSVDCPNQYFNKLGRVKCEKLKKYFSVGEAFSISESKLAELKSNLYKIVNCEVF